MQRESVNQKRGVSARNWIVWLAVLIAAPATLLVAWRFGNRKYYLSSLLLIVYAMLPFFVRFEHKKPQARELVTIAVMSAVAVASRAAFIMVPFFKPLTGIVMITGMALGPEAGFLTGAISGFVSNFIFGQGPWTPWQMFAFGVAGFLAGVLAKKGWLTAEKRLPAGLFGGLLVLLLIGPILGYMLTLYDEHRDHGGIRGGHLSGRASGQCRACLCDFPDGLFPWEADRGKARPDQSKIWHDGRG